MIRNSLALIGALTVALLALLSVAGLLVLRGARSPWPALERDPEFAAAMGRVAKDPQWKPFRHRQQEWLRDGSQEAGA